MKKIITTALILAFCIQNASAMENLKANYDTGTDIVTVSGTDEAGKSIMIVVPGKDEQGRTLLLEDITEAGSIFNKIKIFGETKTDEDGNFVKTFRMNPQSDNGTYTVYIGANALEDAESVTFSYTNPATVAGYTAEINSADKDTVGGKIEAYADALQLDLTNWNLQGEKKSETARLFAEVIRPTAGYKLAGEIQKGIEQAIALEKLNSCADAASVKTELEAYAELLNIDLSVYKNVGNEQTKENKQNKICEEVLTVLPVSDLAAFSEKLGEIAFTADITAPEDWATLQSMMTATYKDRLKNITAWSKYELLTDKAAVFKEIYKTSFASVLEAETLFNAKAEAKYLLQNSSSGTGSGSGGGGSSGGGSTNKTNNVTINIPKPTEEIKPSEVKDLFDDINDASWAKSDIEKLARKKVISGDGTGNVYPNRTVTREEFITMVVKAFGFNPGDAELKFTDVQSGAWYEGFVKTAFESGLISGISEDKFGIGEEITRQDMAVILARTAEKLGIQMTAGEESFSDMSSAADYAKDAILRMRESGVITGMSDGSFRPEEKATRAQTAVMINRLLGKM